MGLLEYLILMNLKDTNLSKKKKTKMFELRAAMSLYRLLTNQGRSDEGREFLNEAYNKFTEGFASIELMETKRILESS